MQGLLLLENMQESLNAQSSRKTKKLDSIRQVHKLFIQHIKALQKRNKTTHFRYKSVTVLK